MCRFKALCAVKYDGGYERAQKKERERGESEHEEKRERERKIPGVEQPLMSLLAPS